MGGGHGRKGVSALVFDSDAKLIQKLLRHDVDPEPLCIGNGVNQRGMFTNDAALGLVLDVDVKVIPIHFMTSTVIYARTQPSTVAREDAVTEETDARCLLLTKVQAGSQTRPERA